MIPSYHYANTSFSYTGAGWATHVKTHPGTSNPKLVELCRKIKIQKAPGSQS